MIRHEHSRDILIPGAAFNDDLSGLKLVLAADFLIGHLAGAGYLAVEVISVSGTERGYPHTSLCERCSIPAVSMHYSAYAVKVSVYFKVGGSIT